MAWVSHHKAERVPHSPQKRKLKGFLFSSVWDENDYFAIFTWIFLLRENPCMISDHE